MENRRCSTTTTKNYTKALSLRLNRRHRSTNVSSSVTLKRAGTLSFNVEQRISSVEDSDQHVGYCYFLMYFQESVEKELGLNADVRSLKY